jgi:hypothetical protein
LPKAALSHLTQGFANTASDVGYGNYFKALGNKVFNGDEQGFIHDSGIKNIAKEERSTLDKVTAPGLKQLRSFHQQVAVLAGKYNADALAAKGDEAGLQKIGVTGDFTRNADGNIDLTRTQQLQAGKAESDKSIFSDSSLETNKFLNSTPGKAFGQFRTAFVAKQGGFITGLMRQARQGDVAPLLRYLAVGVPVTGAVTTALKAAYSDGTSAPATIKGNSLATNALNAAQNSGIESLGFGAPESAINLARYNFNPNATERNVAGTISPLAGIGVEAGQNIDTAIRTGNDKPLIKQGAGYIPLPVVGKMIDNKYAPAAPGQAAINNFYNATGAKYSTQQAAQIGSMTPSQQKDYTQAGVALKGVGITNPADVHTFAGLSPSNQASYIKAATSLNTAGKAISNTSIQSQLVKEGNISLAASMNKDIPSQLPPEAKTTLETYSTLGTGGQKDVWLQNNGNADNYYKAVIAQKQAQGALTTDDTDTGATWSGSGNSLYVKALVAETDQKNNVSQETQELYKNTDLTKYKDMTGAEKTALTTYAQQLNAAGVMDKYDLYEGGDSSSSDDSGYSDSSSGSSASDLDRADGMPDGTQTLLKPKDNSNLKAADTAKYVAPKLLDDKPSSHNGNPFIRSISVSKGLK